MSDKVVIIDQFASEADSLVVFSHTVNYYREGKQIANSTVDAILPEDLQEYKAIFDKAGYVNKADFYLTFADNVYQYFAPVSGYTTFHHTSMPFEYYTPFEDFFNIPTTIEDAQITGWSSGAEKYIEFNIA